MPNSVFFKLAAVLFFCFPIVFGQNEIPIVSKNGMVVSAEPIASKIGKDILAKGGNAVDASVAVGFALAVTYPVAGNLGGGGFMVIHTPDNRNICIDYRERAPAKAFRDMYLDSAGNPVDDRSLYGALAAGVPGSVAGLLYALEKYGTLPLATVIQPAIDLAEQGFKVSRALAQSFKAYQKDFNRYSSTKKVFLKTDGNIYNEAELFIQTDLAKTLALIRDYGRDGFYKGPTAEKIVSEMNRSGGIISYEDLLNYTVTERNPIIGEYKGYSVVSMPPSSSGGVTLIEMLNILENTNLSTFGFGSSAHLHYLTSSMKFAYADRSEYLGDPDYTKVPLQSLLSKEYAKRLFNKISSKALSSSEVKPGLTEDKESHQTTHYSTADSFGTFVSVTTTINSGYGSMLVVDGAGFLLNNEMDDFSVKPGYPNQFGLLGGDANAIEPGKRMLSSMTPTIVLKKTQPVLVLGTPGGSTIITSVLQVILNCIEFGMPLKEAMHAPRLHHQWYPESIYFEEGAIDSKAKNELETMGYKDFKPRRLGLIEAIYINPKTGLMEGMSDPRGSGSAEGL